MRRVFLIGLASLPLLAACTLPGETPPPAPPVQVVFFTEDSSSLDEAAQGVVAQVAQAAQTQPEAPVQVLGFADPDGGRAYNQALSAARAENVAAALRTQGVAPARIRVAPRGPVPFEMMPLESRRVEIRIGQEQVTP